jgi:gas vesicle protein
MSTRIEKYWYVVLGSMVGAGVALLFAPQTGDKTRRQIAKYGRKAGSRAQVFVGDIAESLDCVVRDALEKGGTGLEKGKKLTDRARNEILEVLEAGKKYLEEEKHKLDKVLK